MKRCVIIGGAPIQDYPHICRYLKDDDFYIFCDSGLYHKNHLGVEPSLIVGDFDSHDKPELPVETLILPREKDDTDTFFAVKEALSRGYDNFLLLGVIGARIDHTLGNISALLYLDSQEKKALIADDYSEMEIVSRNPVYLNDQCCYFSLLNISGTARGITVENAKYPLEQAEISCEYQFGISNEVLPGKTAKVFVSEGRLLLVRVKKT